MKLWITSLILIVSLLVGCGDQNDNNATNNVNNNTNNNTEETNNETEASEAIIVVTLSKDDGEEVISEEEVTIQEGDILMDVMKEHFDAQEDNGFITSIDGIEADDPNEEGWLYFVDEQEAPVGAAEYELSGDEDVRFDFQKWN